jgi:quercetin dioxygenase-like cupin family protein
VVVAALLTMVALGSLAVAVSPTQADEGAGDHGFLAGPAEFSDDVAVQIRDRVDGRGTNVVNLRDASGVVVDEARVSPGHVLPWHTHPGPLVIVVAEGEFTYVLADDCVRREYSEGEALIDPGGDSVHTAYNPQDEDKTVLVATYLGIPDDVQLTTPVSEEKAEALDDECDIDTPSPE